MEVTRELYNLNLLYLTERQVSFKEVQQQLSTVYSARVKVSQVVQDSARLLCCGKALTLHPHPLAHP